MKIVSSGPCCQSVEPHKYLFINLRNLRGISTKIGCKGKLSFWKKKLSKNLTRLICLILSSSHFLGYDMCYNFKVIMYFQILKPHEPITNLRNLAGMYQKLFQNSNNHMGIPISKGIRFAPSYEIFKIRNYL